MLTTVDYASNYLLNERIGDSSIWEEADNSTRTKALLMATRIINRFNYAGERSSPTQVDEFPRGCSQTQVSDSIQQACTEVALAILEGWSPDQESANLGVVSQGLSKVQETYDRNRPAKYKVAGLPSLTVWQMLQPYFRDEAALIVHRE
jgi:hypothetical protein